MVIHEPNVICAECGKPFWKEPGKISRNKSGLHFCKRACYFAYVKHQQIRSNLEQHEKLEELCIA